MFRLFLVLIFGIFVGFLASPLKVFNFYSLDKKIQSVTKSAGQEKNSQNSASVCPVQPEVSLRISGVAKNSEKDQDELLMKYPALVLRRAYQRKTEDFEKQFVENRFSRPKNETDRKEQRENVYAKLIPVFDQGEIWSARGTMEVAKMTLPVTFVLSFYDAREWSATERLPLSKLGAENVCWLLKTFIMKDKKISSNGNSNCLGGVSILDGEMFIVNENHFDELEAIIPYLALGLPNASGAAASFEALDLTDGRKWKKQSRLDWHMVSKEEADQIEKDLKQSE